MKILPNLPAPTALHPPSRRTGERTVQPLAPVERPSREYPQSGDGAEGVARAMLAERLAADSQGRRTGADEPLAVRRALDAYRDGARNVDRDYLSSVLGIDEFA